MISTHAQNVDRFAIPRLRRRGSPRIPIDDGKLTPSLRCASEIAALFIDARRFAVIPIGFVPLPLRMEHSTELMPCGRFHRRLMNSLKKAQRSAVARQRLVRLALGERERPELP